MIFVRKINKIPKFYMIIDRKIFFPIFFWGGGARAPCPAPVSYASGNVAYVNIIIMSSSIAPSASSSLVVTLSPHIVTLYKSCLLPTHHTARVQRALIALLA